MNIGIVGAESSKFTLVMEKVARDIIYDIIIDAFQSYLQSDRSPRHEITIVSGGCHLGGIDTWAEEIAHYLELNTIIHLPKHRQWSGGYRERNLLIARDSDIVHCIVVAGYHADYKGMRFKHCYHCHTDSHVKSGACWTAKRAKQAQWHVIPVC